MKNFVKENWYKMIIGCSFFMISVSALIYTTGNANANESYPVKPNNGYSYIVKNNILYYLGPGFDGNYNSHWVKAH